VPPSVVSVWLWIDRVFDRTDTLLHFALRLIGFASRLQRVAANNIPGSLFYLPLRLIGVPLGGFAVLAAGRADKDS
jgi:hypothetical protein